MDTLYDEIKLTRAEVREVRESQIQNTADVKEHIRRTAAAEANITMLRQELDPVKLHVAVTGALAKILGLVGTLVGIGVGALKLMGKV